MNCPYGMNRWRNIINTAEKSQDRLASLIKGELKAGKTIAE